MKRPSIAVRMLLRRVDDEGPFGMMFVAGIPLDEHALTVALDKDLVTLEDDILALTPAGFAVVREERGDPPAAAAPVLR